MEDRQDARGYLYQAMTLVLAAVREDSRVQVQLDPDLENRCVELTLRRSDGALEAARVQGSAQPFTETDVTALAEGLLCRVQEAAQYRLVLVGPCSVKLREIVQSISTSEKTACRATEALRIPPDMLSRLMITLAGDDFTASEALLIEELGLLLRAQGFASDTAQLQYVLSAVSYRFTQFSTNAHFVSGRFFIRKLTEWVDACFPDVSESSANRSGLSVQFYHDGQFSGVCPALRPGIVRGGPVRDRIARLRSLCHEIGGVPLPPRPELPFPLDEDALTCEFSAETQAAVRRRASALLRLELPEGFFRLGGLKRRSSAFSSPELEGTAIERAQYEKLLKLSHGLEQLEGLLHTFAQLDSYRVIPLALCSAADCPYPQLTVQLELPKDLTLLTAESFPRPVPCVLRELTGEEGLLHRFLRQTGDDMVTAYAVPWSEPGHYAYLYLGEQRAEQEIRDACADFEAYIRSMFRFSVDDSDPQRRILELEFDGLRPGQSIAFPCFLFVQTTRSFTISYRILSRALEVSQRGRLEYSAQQP